MLIRDALQLLASATLSPSRKVALLCSFEPLHLRTYLQAYLIDRLRQEAPEVAVFGYDQLHAGLAATSTSLSAAPALLCLSWEDIHPALSWRTRTRDVPAGDDITREGARLSGALTSWIAARRGAATFVVPPPLDFLPLLDPCASTALGEVSLTASAVVANLLTDLSREGARILKVPSFDLNYRDLLLAGCPLSAEHAEWIARTFVALGFDSGSRKKAIVTDLDGTLWHGVIGEDGPAALAHAAEGRGYPFHVFQQFLLKLKREGILLAFCTKNNPDDVLPVFDALDMPLKLADFAAYRCDWEPKSAGIRSIARELNIGDDALVVIDDDPAELAEIGHVVAGAALCRTPREGQDWLELFRRLQDLCATWAVSHEDRIRPDAAAQERRRRDAREAGRGPAGGLDGLSYLRDLNLEVTIQKEAFDDPRSLELINRTNQFNLTGGRVSEEEWLRWAATPGAFCWSARLKDRFGDFGTICVITGSVEGQAIRLRQFVLSCRAFGRGVEATVLGELVNHYGSRQVRGPLVSTGKNEPARRFVAAFGADADAAEWTVEGAAAMKAWRDVVDQTGATNRTAAAGARA
jgi:FkbH-like protein